MEYSDGGVEGPAGVQTRAVPQSGSDIGLTNLAAAKMAADT